MNFVPDISNLWIAKAVRDRFAEDAIERDRRGGRPAAQIRLLKKSGLLTIVIPKQFGDAGEPYSTALRITREFARVDGSVGHIYGYHFSALLNATLSIGDPQAEDLLRRSAEGNWFWGNTGNSFSKTLFGRKDGEWTVVNGFKPFASGSHVADYVTTSWEDRRRARGSLRPFRPTARG
jgi:alkylation response protein AidB-like acyl-CoA dehydrogenase